MTKIFESFDKNKTHVREIVQSAQKNKIQMYKLNIDTGMSPLVDWMYDIEGLRYRCAKKGLPKILPEVLSICTIQLGRKK